MSTFLYIILGIIVGLPILSWFFGLIHEIGVKLKIFKSPEQLHYEAVLREGNAAKRISMNERINKQSSYAKVEFQNMPSYEGIDLGLSVKWAPVNIGADNSYQSGDYFAWGETVIKGDEDFKPDTSLTFGMSDADLTEKGIVANGKLTPAHDVASVAWGNGWRMPTEKELLELFTKCTNQWIPGVGIELRGRNGRHITLPITGFCDETGPRYRHPNGSNVDVVSIWTSTRNGETGGQSLLYDFNNSTFTSGTSTILSTKSYIGLCVRPVHD